MDGGLALRALKMLTSVTRAADTTPSEERTVGTSKGLSTRTSVGAKLVQHLTPQENSP